MPVDSFAFLPRLISTFYQSVEREPELPIPWTPVTRPLAQTIFGLITSAGLYHAPTQPPFDMEREQAEPTWGDPTFRAIPGDVPRQEIAASHLHLNTTDLLADINIQLPLDRFRELAEAGEIGGVARVGYSFMGYQGYPPDAAAWQNEYGPQVAGLLKAEGVTAVLLTPA
ncbi:MAG: hypothetical protein KJ063_12910 [Anaerolineae bacterium]|nr:hypothetical protein [Anaerolineae bacterium]